VPIEWREALNGKHRINSLGRLRAIRRGGALRIARQDAKTPRRQTQRTLGVFCGSCEIGAGALRVRLSARRQAFGVSSAASSVS
jgi:hypothetical protein